MNCLPQTKKIVESYSRKGEKSVLQVLEDHCLIWELIADNTF